MKTSGITSYFLMNLLFSNLLSKKGMYVDLLVQDMMTATP